MKRGGVLSRRTTVLYEDFPSMQIYWGDIHNHNDIGYGKGSLERSFAIAANSLDFYAFTPHTWWPDLPDNDEAVKQHHLAGFEKVRANWDRIGALARAHHCSGRFVPLLAWEWHSLAWGDYCVYFPDEKAECCCAGTLNELQAFAQQRGAILIPHHVAYCQGWRGCNWQEFAESSSPVVEIFSEHGNSMESSSHLGMYAHSMGGVESAQTALVQLQRGRRFGVVASTDDHYGYPGGYGYGLTAVLAEALTREAIFTAIRQRHTYAATGDRIKIFFRLNDGMMGDALPAASVADISFAIEARDHLQSVGIYKNGKLFRSCSGVDFAAQASEPERHLLRVEWGWDMIASKEITRWEITIRSRGGAIADPVPSFCGGAGSVTETNLLQQLDDGVWRVTSFTSRKNALPVNSLSFFWEGAADAGLELDVSGEHEGKPFRRSLSLSKESLLGRDCQVAVIDRFSAPKIKVHALVSSAAFAFRGGLRDEQVSPGDFYFLKVVQENGQMAWSSPVWVG